MKKKAKRTLTPKLRFPEFRDGEEWEEQPLGSVSQFVKKKIPLHQLSLDTYVSTENLSPDYGGIEQASKLPPNGSATEYKPDDILIANIRPYLRKVWRANRAGGASNDVIVIRPKAVLRKDYLPMIIANDTFINYVMKTAKGVKMPRGDIASMKEYIVYYPSPAEQQKIAKCLGSLDDWIGTEGQKLAALRDHKRGLMQQLFPQPGQSQPRLRFPEFRDKGKWEVEPLGKIAEIKLGKMLDKNKHRSGYLLPYLNNLAIRWNDFDTSDLPVMYFNDDELERYDLRTGDVIVCEGGEPGRSAVWDERLPGLKFQKALHRVRFKIHFVPQLLVHYLETIAGTPAFESLFTGGGIKHLTGQTFAQLALPIASPAEQQRIADCLTALDTQITAQAAKIEALKQHKRGLMQQIFPAPETI